MAQLQKSKKASHARKNGVSHQSALVASDPNSSLMVTSETLDAQDERRWQKEFQDSLDVLSVLADKALADYEAGRTTKISA